MWAVYKQGDARKRTLVRPSHRGLSGGSAFASLQEESLGLWACQVKLASRTMCFQMICSFSNSNNSNNNNKGLSAATPSHAPSADDGNSHHCPDGTWVATCHVIRRRSLRHDPESQSRNMAMVMCGSCFSILCQRHPAFACFACLLPGLACLPTWIHRLLDELPVSLSLLVLQRHSAARSDIIFARRRSTFLA